MSCSMSSCDSVIYCNYDDGCVQQWPDWKGQRQVLPAEVYGRGKSEKYLADFQRDTGTSVKIATKFAPLPWRLTQAAPVKALKVWLINSVRIEGLQQWCTP